MERVRLFVIIAAVIAINLAIWFTFRPVNDERSSEPEVPLTEQDRDEESILQPILPDGEDDRAGAAPNSPDTVRVRARVIEHGTRMPIPNFEYSPSPPGDQAAPSPETNWDTARAGSGRAEFRIPRLEGDQLLWFRAPGYVAQAVTVQNGQVEGGVLNVNVMLVSEERVGVWEESGTSQKNEGSATLEGVVTIGGEAPKSLRVTVSMSDRPGSSRGYSTSQHDEGAFVIEKLPLGEGRINIEAALKPGQWRYHDEIVSFNARRTYTMAVDLPGAGTIKGRVMGIPPEAAGGVLVIEGEIDTENLDAEAVYDLGALAVGEARTGELGVYSVAPLEPGRYTVIALAEFHYTGDDGNPQTAFWYASAYADVTSGKETEVMLNVQ